MDHSPVPIRFRRPPVTLVLVVVGLLVAACGTAGGTPTGEPTGTPAPSGTPSPSDGSFVDHPTGPTDLVFRFAEGGGFVPIDFFAAFGPQFSLYGDGTVIFRDQTAELPPAVGNVIPLTPYSTARLSEPQVQAFLRFALDDGGLGVALAEYHPGNVADAPTATFTVNARGLSKTVAVEALGLENPESPDAAILHALAGLGERVRNFGSSVEGEMRWMPERWRGILAGEGVGAAQPWPWTDLAPADFVEATGPGAPRFPIHTLVQAQVDALGLTGLEGGFTGLTLAGPDGRIYAFVLRPLLPDEAL